MLPLAFYQRPTERVARDMLGKILVVRRADEVTKVRILETEAYLGPNDLACHSSKGRTARTEVMFGSAGVSYVYLIYGMYHCFNVVTGKGQAVLVRAAEDVDGRLANLRLDGPGKVCRAMDITVTLNKLSLQGPTLWLEDAPPVRRIAQGSRVGVAYAKEWAEKPYRYWIEGHPGVSRAR